MDASDPEHEISSQDSPSHRGGQAGVDRSISQTLSRGLCVLETLAKSNRPMTVQELASTLQLSRSILYRLLRTLIQHELVTTGRSEGQFQLGLGLLTLSRDVQRDVRQSAFPILQKLASEVEATAVLGLRYGDEIVYVISADPEHAQVTVRSREGMRRPVSTDSTSGIAILSSYAAAPNDTEEVRRARSAGFAFREGLMEQRASAMSAPIPSDDDHSDACVTMLIPSPTIKDVETKGQQLIAAASRFAAIVRHE